MPSTAFATSVRSAIVWSMHRLAVAGLLMIATAGHATVGTPARIDLDGLLRFGTDGVGEFPALSGDGVSVALLHSPTGPEGSAVLDVIVVDGSTLERRFEFTTAEGASRELPKDAMKQVRSQVEEANAYLSENGFLVMQPLYALHRQPVRPVEEFLSADRRIVWESATGQLTIGSILAESMFARGDQHDSPFVPRHYQTDHIEFSRRWALRELGRAGNAECEVRPVPHAGWVNLDLPPQRAPVLVLRVRFEPLSEDCGVPDDWVVAPLRREPESPAPSPKGGERGHPKSRAALDPRY